MNKELDLLMQEHYNKLLDVISPGIFSLSIHNNWLFFILGFIGLVSALCFGFWLTEDLKSWLNDKRYTMKNRYGSEFLNYTLLNLKAEKPEINFKITNGNEYDLIELNNYKNKIKDFKELKRAELVSKYGVAVTLIFGVLSIFSMGYGTVYLWTTEDSFLEEGTKSYYSAIKDDYIKEEEADIINVQYFEKLTTDDLIKEYGQDEYKKLSFLFRSYGYIDEDSPVYLFDIKTSNGKYEKIYVYEKDMDVYEAKTSRETKVIQFKDYGSRYNFNSEYIDELSYFGGIKEAKIYISEESLEDYLNGKPLLIK